jgi:hypothetical protein
MVVGLRLFCWQIKEYGVGNRRFSLLLAAVLLAKIAYGD